MNNLQNKLKAYTLTEAIVTIIVLGIVATIIIGVIKPVDASKEAMMTLAKKTQQNITEAISQMYINDSDFDNILQLKDATGQFNITDENAIDRFVPIIKKYVQDNGTAIDQTKEADYFTSEIIKPDKTKTGVVLNASYSHFYFMSNGVLLGFKLNGNCTTAEPLQILPDKEVTVNVENTCGAFFVDVNGYKKPNKLGSDQFIFPFDAKFMKYI